MGITIAKFRFAKFRFHCLNRQAETSVGCHRNRKAVIGTEVGCHRYRNVVIEI